MKRGVFIVIEGVDRSGKTSQCHRIVERLNTEGITAKFYGFPSIVYCAKCDVKTEPLKLVNRLTSTSKTLLK